MFGKKPKTDDEIIHEGILKGFTKIIVGSTVGIGVGYIVSNAIIVLVPAPAKLGLKVCWYVGGMAMCGAAGDIVAKTIAPEIDAFFDVSDTEVSEAINRKIHVEVEDVEHKSEETATA